MESSNILKTALGVGILGTLAVFLTYNLGGEETLENVEGTESTNIDASSTSMEEVHIPKTTPTSITAFWQNAYNSIKN